MAGKGSERQASKRTPMQILLGQKPALDGWLGRDVAAGAADGPSEGVWHDAYERLVGREATGPPLDNGPHRKVAAALFRYDIFPPAKVTPVLEREPLEEGSTVGICYHLLPLVDLFFACRVIEKFDRAIDDNIWRTGFMYRTLDGHPELGEEAFCVEKDMKRGDITVALRSWSRPGNAYTRTVPWLARRLQVAASWAALDHLERVAAR
jgi:uncharacterized protein (UPF0548 family)